MIIGAFLAVPDKVAEMYIEASEYVRIRGSNSNNHMSKRDLRNECKISSLYMMDIYFYLWTQILQMKGY